MVLSLPPWARSWRQRPWQQQTPRPLRGSRHRQSSPPPPAPPESCVHSPPPPTPSPSAAPKLYASLAVRRWGLGRRPALAAQYAVGGGPEDRRLPAEADRPPLGTAVRGSRGTVSIGVHAQHAGSSAAPLGGSPLLAAGVALCGGMPHPPSVVTPSARRLASRVRRGPTGSSPPPPPLRRPTRSGRRQRPTGRVRAAARLHLGRRPSSPSAACTSWCTPPRRRPAVATATAPRRRRWRHWPEPSSRRWYAQVTTLPCSGRGCSSRTFFFLLKFNRMLAGTSDTVRVAVLFFPTPVPV